MHAEIIAIGTEITSGAKLDTNSQWLSQRLADLGVATRYHSSVADDFEANVEVMRLALQRADVVLVTGGLGPTRDDLTRQALAAAAGVTLREDPESLRAIEEYFASRGRPMPASNRVQAHLPEGSEVIPNPIGTAPGIWMEIQRPGRHACRLAAFPGVPSEMKPMFREHVERRIAGGVVIRRAQINCFGLGESQTEELLGDITARGRDPEVGITAHDATISLRIIAHAATGEECQRKLDAATTQIRELLGDFVFGADDEDLEHVVSRLLVERGKTVAICEWATGGNLVQRVLASGAEGICRGGLVLSEGSDVMHQLGMAWPSEPIGSSAAGRTLAQRLAATCRARFHADYALAVTPMGRAPLPDGRGVAAAWAALATNADRVTAEARQTGNPAIFASRTAKIALDLLRRELLGLPQFDPGGA